MRKGPERKDLSRSPLQGARKSLERGTNNPVWQGKFDELTKFVEGPRRENLLMTEQDTVHYDRLLREYTLHPEF